MGFTPEKIILFLSISACLFTCGPVADGKTRVIIRREKPVIRGEAFPPRFGGYGEPPLANRAFERDGSGPLDSMKFSRRRENQIRNYPGRYKSGIHSRDPPLFRRRRRPGHSNQVQHSENDVTFRRRRKGQQKSRIKSLQKPKPPAEDEFDSDDYFPEETKRATPHYAHSRRPAKKRRHPAKEKKTRKPSPDDDGKFDFDDDRKNLVYSEEVPRPNPNKPKREPTVSYSTFVQHSPPYDPAEAEYDYPDVDDSGIGRYRKKKRRIKKKTNKHVSEENGEEYVPDGYSPELEGYPTDDDHETGSVLRFKKYKQETVYGEGHAPHSSSGSVPVYASTKFIRSPAQDDHSTQQYNSQSSNPFNAAAYPPHFQSITNPSVNFRPTYGSHPSSVYSQPPVNYDGIGQHPHPSEFSIQKSNSFSLVGSTGFHSNNPVLTYDNLTPSASTISHGSYRNPQEQQPAVYYPTTAVPPYNDAKSSYGYDSADSFSGYNSNGASHNKYSSYSFRYGDRGSASVPSVQVGDTESDFLQKHRNLYNNGISGIPVQGDGYMNRDGKKDFDIGYGEFQFDENPA